MQLKEVPFPEVMKAAGMTGRRWTLGALSIIGTEDYGLEHWSFALPDRLPTWDEIKEAKDALNLNQKFYCVPFPTREYWVNVHNYCLHLWEVKDHPLVEYWKGL